MNLNFIVAGVVQRWTVAKMSDKKLCPLNGFKECCGEECAWYQAWGRLCAILDISERIARLNRR